MMESPQLMMGQHLTNDRGGISFVNDFTFNGVKRFYMLHNRQAGMPREWHGHRTEFKYVMMIKGAAKVAGVAIDDWQNPSKDAKVYCYELSAAQPMVLYIPPGYANCFKALTDDVTVMFFSNLTVEQSHADDFRWPADYWDPWSKV